MRQMKDKEKIEAMNNPKVETCSLDTDLCTLAKSAAKPKDLALRARIKGLKKFCGTLPFSWFPRSALSVAEVIHAVRGTDIVMLRADDGAVGCAALRLGIPCHLFAQSEAHKKKLLKVLDDYQLKLNAEKDDVEETDRAEIKRLFGITGSTLEENDNEEANDELADNNGDNDEAGSDCSSSSGGS